MGCSVTLTGPKEQNPGWPDDARVRLTPEDAVTSSTLLCTPENVGDADSGDGVFLFSWSIGDVVVEGEASETLGSSLFSKSDVVACSVRPIQNGLLGPQLTSNEVQIGNTLPSVSVTL